MHPGFRFFLLISLLASLALGTGCPSETTGDDSGKPYVVATTGMIADAVAIVGGDHISSEGLMGPGVDPHLFKPGQNHTRMLRKADAIFFNGLHLEGKMGDILTKLAREKKVYAIGEDLPEDRLREPPEFAGLYDPHVWFDVDLWKLAVRKVEQGLSELVPEHADDFKANADAYVEELDELDAWIKERIAEIPEESRVLVTAHDAFGYFGARYGIEVRGLQGVSTVSDIATKDIEEIIESVRRGAERRGHRVVVPRDALFSDAMGAADTPEGTYVGMVRHNVNTIVDALK